MSTSLKVKKLLLKLASGGDPLRLSNAEIDDTLSLLRRIKTKRGDVPPVTIPTHEDDLIDHLTKEKLSRRPGFNKVSPRLGFLKRTKNYLTSGWRPLAIGGTAALGTGAALYSRYKDPSYEEEEIDPELAYALENQELQAGLPPQM